MLRHLIFSLLLAGSLAAPADPLPKSASPAAKSGVDSEKNEDPKAAATLEEQDKARTHALLNHLRPSHGSGSNGGYPAAFPGQYYPPFSYNPPLLGRPVFAPIASATHFQPSTSAVPVAPFHVSPVNSQPVTHVGTTPVVAQNTCNRPFVWNGQQTIGNPSYPVSQQVIHRPVITELQHIVRRPVITELQEVIHKPYLTEYQQVIRLPTHTLHVVKKPSYSAIHQETVQSPIILNSEQYHVVDKPSAQVLQLPPQFMQPFSTEIAQIPSVRPQTETQTTVNQTPSVALPTVSVPSPPIGSPVVSYLPSTSYGVSGIGNPGNLGSIGTFGGSYGSSIGGYGSNFGASYAGNEDEAYGYYYTPGPSCRGGACEMKRDTEGHEILVMPGSSSYNNREIVPVTYSPYNSNVVPNPMIATSQMYFPNNMPWFKNVPQSEGNSQPSNKGRAANENFENLMDVDQPLVAPYPDQTDQQPAIEEDPIIPKFAEVLINDEQFRKMLSEAYLKAKSSHDEVKVKDVWDQLTKSQQDQLLVLVDKMKNNTEVKTPTESTTVATTKTESPKQ